MVDNPRDFWEVLTTKKSSASRAILILVAVVSSHECPAGQIEQTWNNKTRCCIPAFNCPKHHQIVPCTENEDAANINDQCVKCAEGTVNNHVTSSVDADWTKYRCFQIDEKSKCSPDDHLPYFENYSNCAMKCECDYTKCYFGVPCGCQQVSECAINEELKVKTGKCEPCRPNTYKTVTGCEPCTWNETAWRLSLKSLVAVKSSSDSGSTASNLANNPAVAITAEPGVIITTKDTGYKIPTDVTEKEPAKSRTDDNKGTNNEGGAPVAWIIILILIFVAAALVLACILYIRHQKGKGNQSSRLVALYNRLPCVNENQPVATEENGVEKGMTEITANGKEENGVQNGAQNGVQNGVQNGTHEVPVQKVGPMVKNGTNHSNGTAEGDGVPYCEMSLNVTANDHDDSCTPLMVGENDAATDVKTTES